jgi:hypothetical protein
MNSSSQISISQVAVEHSIFHRQTRFLQDTFYRFGGRHLHWEFNESEVFFGWNEEGAEVGWESAEQVLIAGILPPVGGRFAQSFGTNGMVVVIVQDELFTCAFPTVQKACCVLDFVVGR